MNPRPEIVDFGLYHAFLGMVFNLMTIEIVLIQFENQPDLFDHFAATSPFIVLKWVVQHFILQSQRCHTSLKFWMTPQTCKIWLVRGSPSKFYQRGSLIFPMGTFSNNHRKFHLMNNFSFSLDYKTPVPKYRRALVVVVSLYLPVLNIHSHTPNPYIGFQIENDDYNDYNIESTGIKKRLKTGLSRNWRWVDCRFKYYSDFRMFLKYNVIITSSKWTHLWNFFRKCRWRPVRHFEIRPWWRVVINWTWVDQPRSILERDFATGNMLKLTRNFIVSRSGPEDSLKFCIFECFPFW